MRSVEHDDAAAESVMLDRHLLEPDHLPTPFTAEEIRDACPPGRTLRYRHERAGQPATVRVSRYVAVDAEGCDQEAWEEAEDGARLGAPERSRSTWLELQRHASFSAATTTRDEEEIDVPAGKFACLRYTRTDDSGTWQFWFARELPGQPVRYERQVGERVLMRATLLDNANATLAS
jgi:hypothetical protein